jgi:hypothetical protein
MHFRLILCILFFSADIPAQSYDWSFRVGGISDEASRAITHDHEGNLLSVGWFAYTVDADPGPGTATLTGLGSAKSGLVAKYDSLGNYLWAFRLGGIGNNEVMAVTCDDSSNVYITGSFSGTADFDPGAGTSNLVAAGSALSIFIAKYDANGNYKWAYQLGSSGGDCEGKSLKTDKHGNLFITGSFAGTVDFNPGAGINNLTAAAPSYNADAFVTSFTTGGQFKWAFRLGASSNDWAYSLAIDSSSNIYITGKFKFTIDFDPGAGVANKTALGNADIFVASYDSTSAFRWAINMGGNGGDEGLYVSVFNSEYVYVTGLFRDSADFDPGPGVVTLYAAGGINDADIFVGKYAASNGNYIHTFRIGSLNSEWAWGIEPDSSGNIYVTGYFAGLADFDPDTSVFNLQPSVNEDIFLAIYDSTGYFKNAFAIASPGTDIGYGIVPDLKNYFYLGGSFSNSSDFDPGNNTATMSSAGSGDLFLARYSKCLSPDTPVLQASSDTICADFSCQLSVNSGNLNDAAQWYWYAGNCGGTPIDSGINISVTPTATTTYYCRGEKNCGGNGYCSAITVYVDVCTGVMNTENDFLAVFPNPVSGMLNVEFTDFSSGPVTFELVDMFGRLVKSETVEYDKSGEQSIQLNISDFPDGNYMLLMKTENEIIRKMVTVNH